MAMDGAVLNKHEDPARSNFVVDKNSRLFFNAQEAKKVSERTVLR